MYQLFLLLVVVFGMKKIISFTIILLLLISCSFIPKQEINILLSDESLIPKIDLLFNKFDNNLSIKYIDYSQKDSADLIFDYYHNILNNEAMNFDEKIINKLNNYCKFCHQINNFVPLYKDYLVLAFDKQLKNIKNIKNYDELTNYLRKNHFKINVGRSAMLSLGIFLEKKSLLDFEKDRNILDFNIESSEQSLKNKDSNYKFVIAGSWMPLKEYQFINNKYDYLTNLFKPVYLQGFYINKNSNKIELMTKFMDFLLSSNNTNLFYDNNFLISRNIFDENLDFKKITIIDHNNSNLLDELNEWLVKK